MPGCEQSWQHYWHSRQQRSLEMKQQQVNAVHPAVRLLWWHRKPLVLLLLVASALQHQQQQQQQEAVHQLVAVQLVAV
jgi:hypothetical protein